MTTKITLRAFTIFALLCGVKSNFLRTPVLWALSLAALLGFAQSLHAATYYPINDGFEDPDLMNGLTYGGTYGWTFFVSVNQNQAGSGIAANGSALGVQNAPNGNVNPPGVSTLGQAAFIQNGNGDIAPITVGSSFQDPSYFFQAFSLANDSTISVNFLMEQRGVADLQSVTVRIDNTNLGTFSTGSTTDFVPENTAATVFGTGAHILYFIGNVGAPVPNGFPGPPDVDATAFIDSVSLDITAVPEPATWTSALLIVGALAGTTLRRIRQRRS